MRCRPGQSPRARDPFASGPPAGGPRTEEACCGESVGCGRGYQVFCLFWVCFAGPADTEGVRIKDKNGDTPLDLVQPEDKEIVALMRRSRAQASVSLDDVASGEYLTYKYHADNLLACGQCR